MYGSQVIPLTSADLNKYLIEIERNQKRNSGSGIKINSVK